MNTALPKLAILLNEMPDKVAEGWLTGRGYEVCHINNKQQLDAYNSSLQQKQAQALENIQPFGTDEKSNNKKDNKRKSRRTKKA